MGSVTEETPAIRTHGPDGAVVVDLAERRYLIVESRRQAWAYPVLGNGEGPFPSIEAAAKWIERRGRSGAAA